MNPWVRKLTRESKMAGFGMSEYTVRSSQVAGFSDN
jgi:hypothetical protein